MAVGSQSWQVTEPSCGFFFLALQPDSELQQPGERKGPGVSVALGCTGLKTHGFPFSY